MLTGVGGRGACADDDDNRPLLSHPQDWIPQLQLLIQVLCQNSNPLSFELHGFLRS